MTDANELPPELQKQLKRGRSKETTDTHSLVLAYIHHRGPATVDELLVYVWKVTDEVTSRDYMYHVLMRLRKRGHLTRLDLDEEPVIRHMLTPEGEAFIEARNIKYYKVREVQV